MSQLPIFDAARAVSIKPIRFSDPLPDLVSPLRVEGNPLHAMALKSEAP
jgi:hypothetical protein